MKSTLEAALYALAGITMGIAILVVVGWICLVLDFILGGG